MIEKILDHVERAQKNLMSQYKNSYKKSNSANFRALLKVFVEEVQEIENVIFDLRDMRYIETAFGYGLDRLGKIVGIERNGLSDEDFKSRIYAQIILNSSDGETELLFTALRLLMKAKEIEYTEYKNQINIYFKSSESDLFLHEQIQKLCLAGIKDVFLYQQFTDPKFQFSEGFLDDFQLVAGSTKDNLIVQSENIDYNLFITTGTALEPDLKASLSDKFITETGEEIEFIGGILTENITKN